MNQVIASFDQENAFLSNFYPSPVVYEGVEYPTVEHAFQAAKTLDNAERVRVRSAATPGLAKRLGRKVALRSDWEQTKIDIMRRLLVEKFKDGPLRTALLATDPAALVEGNRWHDNFWGDCRCQRCSKRNGSNVLGNLLMEIREMLS